MNSNAAAFEVTACCCKVGVRGRAAGDSYDVELRFALAAIAAFRTRGKSGSMPHVRHGGSGNASVAMVGSKFEGTRFENEQIAQTQLPLSTCGDDTREPAPGKGLDDRDPGEDDDATRCIAGELPTCCRSEP